MPVSSSLTEIDAATGGALTKLEDKIGLTAAEEALGLERRGDIQTVGNGVAQIEKGLGVSSFMSTSICLL